MNRRGFIASVLALGAAPAIVRADSLMRIVPRKLVVDELTKFELASVLVQGQIGTVRIHETFYLQDILDNGQLSYMSPVMTLTQFEKLLKPSKLAIATQ